MKAMYSFGTLVVIFLSAYCFACPLQPPEANIDLITQGVIHVGQTVSFQGYGICPEQGDIVEYKWVFPPEAYCIQGDHTANAQCKFYPNGIYEVKLYVKSSTGLWSEEPISPDDDWIETITVNSPVGSVWYVKLEGDDGQDGQSWANAFKRIQTAIKSASDGDEIKIACGSVAEPAVYYEQLDIEGKSVYLHSEDPDSALSDWELAESTIIDAQKQGTAVIFNGNETEPSPGQANIKGITIRNGYPMEDSLALHLDFNNESIIAADISNKERNGTNYGAVWTSNGYEGGAGQFNGDDYIVIDSYRGVTGGGARTVCAWIKSTGNPSDAMVIASWGSSNNGEKWMFRIDSHDAGQLAVGVWGGYIQGNTNVADGDWHHVAAVLPDDGSTDLCEIELYVDGVLEENPVISNDIGRPVESSGSEKVNIGARTDDTLVHTGYFIGDMDDISIYSRALNKEEIQNLANYPDQGLALHLKMDDLISGYTPDSSDYNFDNLVTGATLLSTGYLNSALQFDNSDCFIDFNNYEELKIQDEITLAVWVKIDNPNLDRAMRIISKKMGWDGPDGYQLEYNPLLNRLSLQGSGNDTCSANNVNLDTGWHHIAAVANGTTSKIYVDGIDCTTDGTIGSVIANDLPLRIGRQTSGTCCQFEGALDDLRIYRRALNADEIGFLSDHHTNLIVHYTFDEITSVVEDSVSSYHGLVQGNPNEAPGLFGNAGFFDGSDDFIIVDGAGQYSTYSISMWFKVDGATELGGVLLQDAHYTGSESYGKPHLYMGPNRNYAAIAAGGYDAGVISSCVGTADGNWHHVVATVDTATDESRIYVDGKFYQSTINTPAALLDLTNGGTSETRVEIGARSRKGSYFEGLIDEFKLFNKVLSSDEVAAMYKQTSIPVPEKNLLAHYKLDGNCADDQGAYANGTLTGNSISRTGMISDALVFDGSTYVDLPNIYNPAYDEFSLFMWLKLEQKSNTDYQAIVVQLDGTSGQGRPLLERESCSDKVFSYLGGKYTYSETAIFDETNTWHHIGVTYDGKYLSLYIDGRKEGSEMCNGEYTEGGLRLGKHKDVVSENIVAKWNGAMDDIRIYNYAFSDEQAYELYNTGGGIKGNGAAVSIAKCVVEENLAEANGGGISGVDGTISNCYLKNNEADADGGAISGCDADVINCVIAENTAVNAGAILGGSPDIINCTIVNNTALNSVGGIKDSSGTIVNTIVWGNTDTASTIVQDAQIKDCTSTTVDYSCIQDDTPGDLFVPFSSIGVGNIDDNPAMTDDYHLYPGSPCRNAGASGDYSTQTDIDGEARKLNGRVDIGADEESSNSIYVDINANGAATGVDWVNAYTSIQTAINNAIGGEVILVMQGAYPGPIDFNGKAVHLMSMNPLDPDVVTDTVIDLGGSTTTDVVTFDDGETYDEATDSGAILDGFTIKGGRYGIYSDRYSIPKIVNCNITDNSTSGIMTNSSMIIENCEITNHLSGYGIAVYYSSPIISECLIAGNKDGIYFHWSTTFDTTVEDSIIENSIHSGFKLTGAGAIAGCKIRNNGTYGLVIEGNYPARLITNCEITNNHNGGISASNYSSATIKNCLIHRNNNDTYSGYGINLSSVSAVTIENCTVSNNYDTHASYQSYGVSVDNVSDVVDIINTIVWGHDNSIQVLTGAASVTNISHCCIEGGISGTNVINSNPLFVDPPESPTDETYDYHLQYGSQCINAGNDGSNMGAYGNTPTATQFIDDDTYGYADGVSDTWQAQYWVSFDSSVEPPTNPEDSWAWDVDSDGDGLRNIDEYYLGWDPTSNDSQGGSGQIPTLVTNLSQGTDGIKYPSITDAIDFASNSDELKAAQATYNESVNFKGKAVHLRSEDPSDSGIVACTTIDGENTEECVIIFDTNEGTDSILDGFTIQNGGCNVFCDDGVYPTILNCVIQNADSSIPVPTLGISLGLGAGVFCKDSITLNNCKIKNNGGVGICFYQYENDPQVIGCEITGNGANSGLNPARGIYAYTESGTSNVIHVSNSIIADNSKASGAVYGIEMQGANVDINQCTILNNYPLDEPESGNGIHGYGHNPEITIRNSIIWANGDDLAGSDINSYSYCCIEDMDEGEGVIHSNPLFNDSDSGDYSLYYASACVDAGDPTDTGWQNEPTGNGGRINIGAYGGTDQATVLIDDDTDGMSDDWEISYFGDLTHGPTLDEDTTAIDGLRNIDEFYNKSDPRVNDSDSGSDTIETLVYNSRIDDGNGVYYPSIMRAIDLAEHNDMLVAEEATYDEVVNFKGKAVHLKSTDPADSSVVGATIIGSTDTPPVLVTKRVTFETREDDTSVLDGFTVRDGGFGVWSGGNEFPVIQNCTVQNNEFISGINDSGTGIYSSGASRIENCISRYNENNGLYLKGETVVNQCEVSQNGETGIIIYSLTANPLISNCKIIENGIYGIDSSNSNMSGSASGRIYNCLIASNNTEPTNTFSYGMHLLNTNVFEITSCTIVDNKDSVNNSFGIDATGTRTTISSTVIWGNGNHNIWNLTGENDSITFSCVQDGFVGIGNINDNPLFIDSENGDYHLKSTEGRWDPTIQQWDTTDTETSPCVDAGQPWADYSNEPAGENGHRINMGVYGNTEYASKSTQGLDEIPDHWQATYWPGTFNPADPDTDEVWSPGEDPDEDNISNEAEYLYGYNPIVANTNTPLQIVRWEQDPMQFDPTQNETIVTKFWINKDIGTTASIDFANDETETATVSFTGTWYPGENQIVWNGTDTTGAEIVLKESYLSKLTAVNDLESTDELMNDITLTYPHEVTRILCSPTRIIPAFNELTSIFYEATVSEDMIIKIYKPDDQGITPFAKISPIPAGYTDVLWDGRSSGGYYPSIEGVYKIKVQFDGMRESLMHDILIGK